MKGNMRCCKCGKEMETGDWRELFCQKCRLEKFREPLLTPREAVIAMLDGATLISPNGFMVRWKEDEGVFADTDENAPRDCFTGYRYQSSKPKTRPMDTFECLAWVNSPDSFGWMVSSKYVGDENWGDWDIPQRFMYDGKEGYGDYGVVSYRRARVLPDKSGIDKSTIQGFLMEVV